MNPEFNGWREGLRFYAPPLAAGLALTALAPNAPVAWLGGLLTLGGLAAAAFFRDFPRAVAAGPGEVVSPADGTVVAIEDLDASPHYDGPSRRISIFLSVFSVHVNRAPLAGTVRAVRYARGKFLDARKPETSQINESNAVWIDTAAGPMTVRQISGAVARRIVCPVAPGTALKTGEKFGMIRFGSRTELYLPPGTETAAAVGEKVYAGLSVIARVKTP